MMVVETIRQGDTYHEVVAGALFEVVEGIVEVAAILVVEEGEDLIIMVGEEGITILTIAGRTGIRIQETLVAMIQIDIQIKNLLAVDLIKEDHDFMAEIPALEKNQCTQENHSKEWDVIQVWSMIRKDHRVLIVWMTDLERGDVMIKDFSLMTTKTREIGPMISCREAIIPCILGMTVQGKVATIEEALIRQRTILVDLHHKATMMTHGDTQTFNEMIHGRDLDQ